MHIRNMTFPLVAGLLAPLAAQEDSVADKFGAAIQSSTSVQREGGAVRAAGWDFDARIDDVAMQFTPALGPQAAATQFVRLTPRSFGRDGSMSSAGPGVPRIQGDMVVQARAPGVSERYDVSADGLELSWLFEAPVAGSGDLVVRYDVETSMASSVTADGGACFALEGVGGVSIGAVTGVDARGVSVAGELELHGSTLELRLPQAFVDDAVFPVLLDPLIGTQFLATTSATYDDSRPDVAYDGSNDVYLVVYRRVFSATSQAIRAQRIDASTGAMIGGFLSVQSVASADNPTVANINSRDTFIVAWEAAPSIFSAKDISCRAINAASGVMSPITIVSSGVGDAHSPDISGDNSEASSAATSGALITYVDSVGGLLLMRVDCATPGAQPVVAAAVTISSHTGAKHPALSKSNPGDGIFAVAWCEPSLGSNALYVRGYDRTLASVMPLGVVVASSQPEPGRCDIDGDGTNFVVLYEVSESGAPLGTAATDIFARGIRADSVAWAFTSGPTPIASLANIEEKDPAIACCGAKYLALYSRQFLPGTNNYDVNGAVLSPSCTPCGASSVLTGLNGTLLRNVEHMPTVCSTFGSDNATSDALIVFAESDDSPPFSSSLVAQRYQSFAGTTVPVVFGSACGTGATIGTVGPFSVGNLGFGVTSTGMPAGSLALITFGAPGATLPLGICGSCVLLNADAAFLAPVIGGSAQFDWPLRCGGYGALGIQFDAQWAILTPGLTACPFLPGFAWSKRMRLTLGL